MRYLAPLVPLLIAAAILQGGNGFQSTLVAVRAGDEGFLPSLIGLMGTTFYGGLLIGTLFATRLIAMVGHIRVFAALASLASVSILVMALIVDPWVWIGAKAMMGFCFSGLSTSIESWLNGAVSNKDRGRILSVYGLVDLGAVTSSQFLLPVLGTEGATAFAVTAMLFSLSLLPITLSPRANPIVSDVARFDIRAAWKISPLAFFSCLTIGLTVGSFRTVAPLYASHIGLDTAGVAVFMSAGIVGGALFQMPLGWLSDRIDRRKILGLATGGAFLAGLFLSLLAGDMFLRNSLGTVISTQTPAYLYYIGSFLFGAFSMPLYSIAVAHANDFATPKQFASLSAGLIFTYAVGATIGPYVGSLVIQEVGPPYFFTFMSLAHGSLLIVALYRMVVGEQAPEEDRIRYTWLSRSSPIIFRFARRRLTTPQSEPLANGNGSSGGETPAPQSRK